MYVGTLRNTGFPAIDQMSPGGLMSKRGESNNRFERSRVSSSVSQGGG